MDHWWTRNLVVVAVYPPLSALLFVVSYAYISAMVANNYLLANGVRTPLRSARLAPLVGAFWPLFFVVALFGLIVLSLRGRE